MPTTKLTQRQKDKMIEAAQTAIQFSVEGRGDFPFDMLRYDLCWPATEAMSALLHNWMTEPQPNRVVFLKGLKPPTPGRWASFGWKVIPQS